MGMNSLMGMTFMNDRRPALVGGDSEAQYFDSLTGPADGMGLRDRQTVDELKGIEKQTQIERERFLPFPSSSNGTRGRRRGDGKEGEGIERARIKGAEGTVEIT